MRRLERNHAKLMCEKNLVCAANTSQELGYGPPLCWSEFLSMHCLDVHGLLCSLRSIRETTWSDVTFTIWYIGGALYILYCRYIVVKQLRSVTDTGASREAIRLCVVLTAFYFGTHLPFNIYLPLLVSGAVPFQVRPMACMWGVNCGVCLRIWHPNVFLLCVFADSEMNSWGKRTSLKCKFMNLCLMRALVHFVKRLTRKEAKFGVALHWTPWKEICVAKTCYRIRSCEYCTCPDALMHAFRISATPSYLPWCLAYSPNMRICGE